MTGLFIVASGTSGGSGVDPLIQAIIALQLALVHVEPPLGFGSAFSAPLPFMDRQIYRCTT